MRFNTVAAAVSAALLAGHASADDAQKVLKEESSSTVEAAASSVAPELPTFTVSFYHVHAPDRRRTATAIATLAHAWPRLGQPS